MKKMSILCSAILGISLIGSTISYSQSSDYAKAGSIRYSDNALDVSPRSKGAGSASASPKSLESFKKAFGNTPDVIWTKTGSNEDQAYFVSDGITVRAGFDKKGDLMYTLRYYSEEHLPKDVLFQIKNTYFGKSIFGVTEVNIDGKTAYLVDLQDKTSWLKIKVLDGEMSEEKVMLKR
jgi:hypothetical protein